MTPDNIKKFYEADFGGGGKIDWKQLYQEKNAELEQLRKEVERLKGLIEFAHEVGYSDYVEINQTQSWQQFKTNNGI